MNRRLVTILLPLSALTLGACSTIDNDAIATVDGVDLEQNVLDEMLTVLPNATQSGPSDPSNADDVRQTMNLWIQSQLVSASLDRLGIETPAALVEQNTAGLSEQLPGFATLSESTRGLLVDLVSSEAAIAANPPVASAEFLDEYAQGPAQSGLICVSHILTADIESATDVKDRLDEGGDFTELAASESTDPGSAAVGGDLGCYGVDEFEAGFDPTFVAATLTAEMGQPTEPVETSFGAHVILVRTAEDSAEQLGTLEVSPQRLVDAADISIDSRYGAFDVDAGGVVALG